MHDRKLHCWSDMNSFDYQYIIALREQLPRELQERLLVTITGDPFGLHVLAVFIDSQTTRSFSCKLEESPEGWLTIPEAFIAHLCAVV
jgi:hypothetical protein